MSKQEEAQMLRYFWEEKGDVTRYIGWEDAIEQFPKIKRAWQKYEAAKQKLSRVLRETCSDIEEFQ